MTAYIGGHQNAFQRGVLRCCMVVPEDIKSVSGINRRSGIHSSLQWRVNWSFYERWNVRSARKRYLLAISASGSRVGVPTMTFLIVLRCEPVCSDGLLQRCGEMCAARENLTCLQSRSRKLDSKFRRGRSWWFAPQTRVRSEGLLLAISAV